MSPSISWFDDMEDVWILEYKSTDSSSRLKNTSGSSSGVFLSLVDFVSSKRRCVLWLYNKENAVVGVIVVAKEESNVSDDEVVHRNHRLSILHRCGFILSLDLLEGIIPTQSLEGQYSWLQVSSRSLSLWLYFTALTMMANDGKVKGDE